MWLHVSYLQVEVFHLTDPYRFPHLKRFLTLSSPDLAMNLHFAYGGNPRDDPPDLAH